MSATLAYVAPESPDELLAINEAAHQAELAAEKSRLAQVQADQRNIDAVGKAASDEAAEQAHMINEARADAMNTVLRAICRRRGQPVMAFGPADAQTAHNFGLALIDLQLADPVQVDPAYLQGSTRSAVARGADVEKALGAVRRQPEVA